MCGQQPVNPLRSFFQDSLFGQLSENPLQLTAAAVQVFRGFPDMDQKPVMAAILDIMQELVLKADEFGLIHCGQLYFFYKRTEGIVEKGKIPVKDRLVFVQRKRHCRRIAFGFCKQCGEALVAKFHICLLYTSYAACQAADPKTSFSAKIVRTMLPDEFKISRLITRKPGNHNSEIKVSALSEKKQKNHTITASFHNKTKKWDAEICGEEAWENEFKDISSIFIPAKEILSNSYNLTAAVEKNNVKFDDTYICLLYTS